MAETQLAFGAAPAARMLPAAEPHADHARDYPLGAPVAQVLDTYVIAVASDGALVLVDQHAAHERLTHEALREQMLDGGVRVAAAAAAGGGGHAAGRCVPPAGARRRTGPARAGDRGVRPWRRDGARAARRPRLARAGAAAARPGRRTGGAGRGHGAERAAGCGDRAAGLPRLDPRRAAAERGRRWMRCCARWRRHRAPPRAATAGRPSSSCRRPRSRSCSAGGNSEGFHTEDAEDTRSNTEAGSIRPSGR